MKLLQQYIHKRKRQALLSQCVRMVDFDRATKRLREGYGLNDSLKIGRLINETV